MTLVIPLDNVKVTEHDRILLALPEGYGLGVKKGDTYEVSLSGTKICTIKVSDGKMIFGEENNLEANRLRSHLEEIFTIPDETGLGLG